MADDNLRDFPEVPAVLARRKREAEERTCASRREPVRDPLAGLNDAEQEAIVEVAPSNSPTPSCR